MGIEWKLLVSDLKFETQTETVEISCHLRLEQRNDIVSRMYPVTNLLEIM